MSHYVDIITELKNREALIKALERVGFKNKIEVHKHATNLYGFQGDVRPQKAHIIIRRQYVGGAANDIGFEILPEGNIKAHISEYDSSRYNEQWLNKVSTYHNVEVARAEAEKYGYTVIEDMDEKQRPRLRIKV